MNTVSVDRNRITPILRDINNLYAATIESENRRSILNRIERIHNELAALTQPEQQAEGQDVDRIERIPGSPLYVRFISNKYDIEEALLCVEDDDADMRDLGTLYSWECANLFLEAAKQSLLTDPHRTLREAEEYQCLEQVFDDRGVPTHEDGKKLSHVGRFIAATQPAEQPEAGRGVCSRCHGVDSDCDALMSDDPTACPCRCHEPQVQEAGWDEAVAVVHDDDSGGHWVELTDDVKDGDLLYLHPPANAEAVRLINLAEDFALAVSSITDETFVLGDDHCVDAHELADEFGEFLAQHGGRGDE